MTDIPIPHNALVLVGDGRKALFLRNSGTPVHPKFIVEQHFEQASIATHEMGTDRPGRTSGPGANRSSMEQTDWHQLDETRFVHSVAEALTRVAHAEPGLQVVLIAPPKAMGDLRSDLDKSLKGHVIAEITRDLTGHPVDQIEKALAIHLP